MVSKGNNGLSIASLVLGILGILTSLFGIGWLFGIAALVTGIIGLVQINNKGGGGKGMAIAGLVCGVLSFLIPIFVLVVLGPAIGNIFNSINSTL